MIYIFSPRVSFNTKIKFTQKFHFVYCTKIKYLVSKSFVYVWLSFRWIHFRNGNDWTAYLFVFFFAWQRIFILKIGRAIDLGMQPKVWFNGEVHTIIKFKIFILFSWIMRTHIHPSMPPSEILFRIRFVLYSLGISYDTRWTLPNNENQNVLLFFVSVLRSSTFSCFQIKTFCFMVVWSVIIILLFHEFL